SSSRSSSSWPSRCAPTSPSWASARSTRPSATPSCSTPARPWTTGRPPAAPALRSTAEAAGPADLLDPRQAVDHWKAAGLDLSPMLVVPELPDGAPLHRVKSQDHGLDIALDQTLIQLCEGALLDARPVTLE